MLTAADCARVLHRFASSEREPSLKSFEATSIFRHFSTTEGCNHCMRLLLIGPLPPPLGGATVLFQQLAKGVTTVPGVNMLMIDTSRKGKIGPLVNALHALQGFALLVIKAPQVDIISFHASIRGAVTFGPFVWFVSKLFHKPFVFRGFGGFFGEWHKGAMPSIKFLFNRTILRSDIVLLETHASVDYFRSFSRGKLMWFPNARPAAMLGPRNHASQHKARRFVFVGHVIPGKGIHQIIEAGERLSDEIVIDIYGPLMEGIKSELFLGKRVRYRGVIEPDQVVCTISQYDVLLLPTCLKTEGYPGVILEAYSVGVPVIASRIGAIAEIVDNTSGILVEPQSVDQLLGAMQTLMSSSQRMEDLRKGAATMAQKFSTEVWTVNFLEICHTLSARTATPGRSST